MNCCCFVGGGNQTAHSEAQIGESRENILLDWMETIMKKVVLALLLIVFLTSCGVSPATPVPDAATEAAVEIVAGDSQTPEYEVVEEPTQPAEQAGGDEASNQEMSATEAAAVPLPTSQPTVPQAVNPLTGLAVDATLLNRRPVGVKIQMFPRNQRPPSGIGSADIVYDYYQNNGMTRLHAIFYGDNAAQVGPIRSARLLDASLVRMYQSVLAFAGADKRILDKLLGADFSDRLIMEGNHNCPPLCRLDPKGADLLITNTEEMTKYAKAKGVDKGKVELQGMVFQEQAPSGGQSSGQIFAHFSISAYARWDYDAANQRYLRFQDMQETGSGQGEGYTALVDRLTEAQISAANVVVLMVPHDYLYKSASGNSEIVEIKLNGSGKAYAFRDGQVYELTWNRAKNLDLFTLMFADGTPYPYKPGNTWFEVMGKNSEVQKQEGGAWRFNWKTP